MWSFHTPDDSVKRQRNDHQRTLRRAAAVMLNSRRVDGTSTDRSNGDEHANVKGTQNQMLVVTRAEFHAQAVRQSQIAETPMGLYVTGHICPYKWMLN